MDEKIEELLPQFKAKMLITWEDDITEIQLKNSLESAIGHLESLTGTSLDLKEVFVRNLIFDCARYYYNNVSEYFEENFQKEILRLQLSEATRYTGSDNDENHT